MSSVRPVPNHIPSFDNTQLAVYDFGGPDLPPVFLFNGLGGSVETYESTINHFSSCFRFISFDYRGIFGSSTPPFKNFSMDAHARDAFTVMDHFNVSRSIYVGWSMGVQTALEVYSRAPERCAGLVLINGVPGKLIENIAPKLKRFILLGMDLVALYYPVLRVYATPLTMSRLSVKVAKSLGILSSNVDEVAFLNLANEYIQLDFANYRYIVYEMAEYDATHILPTITVPTLIISGKRDMITPASASESMANTIHNAELLQIDDASHYSLVEYPELINLRIEQFVKSRIKST